MRGKYQKGKATCKILRQIRQQIADENDIPLITKECTYQGDCKGTCPKCEAELRYLEEQLARRKKKGKRIAVAAVAASLLAGAGGAYASGLAADLAAEFLPQAVDIPPYGTPAGFLAPVEQLDGEIELDPPICDTTEPETTEPEPLVEHDEESDNELLGMMTCLFEDGELLEI